MPDLSSLLVQTPGIQWRVGTVVFVGSTSVTVDSVGGHIPNVGYVDQYVPIVGDTVHFLSYGPMGCLILGSNNLASAPPSVPFDTGPPVTAAAADWATYDSASFSWTHGVVNQGPSTYGVWFYPPLAFASLTVGAGQSKYDIARFEIQVNLISGGPPEFIAHNNVTYDGVIALTTDVRHAPMVVPVGVPTWVPLPIDWAVGMLSGAVKGIGVGGGTYAGSYIGSAGSLRITPL